MANATPKTKPQNQAPAQPAKPAAKPMNKPGTKASDCGDTHKSGGCCH